MTTSRHYEQERKSREALIRKIGTGTEFATFTIDKGHKNGPELHIITTTAIIIIKNERTDKTITKIIARPGQIKRYFSNITEEVQKIINIAKEHDKKKYYFA